MKPTTVEVKEVERRFTRPVAPTPAAKATGPTLAAPEFLALHRRILLKITDRQIDRMRALIAATAEDDPQKPDFFFRAGELYSEQQRFYFTQARALDQPIFELPPDRRGPLQAQQRNHEKQERAWLMEAVKAFIAATRYPKYDRMDEVLFRLAALLTTVKKDDQAREYFHRLIKDHPTSKYIPDAYLVFAEHAFETGEMEAALKFYEKVEQFPKSSVYPYAAYKKGWCHVNLGDYRTALETFVGVVRLTQSGKLSVDRRQLELLAKEAKKDVVKAYAQVGGADRARLFFAKVGGEYAPKMMELLAERYWEDGKAQESTRVYKQIIADNMASPRVCEWQSKVLRNTLSLPSYDKGLVAQELERLGNVYEKAPPTKKEQAAECRASFHDAARELALIWHREAQKTQAPETYEFAERAYDLFLAQLPRRQAGVRDALLPGRAAVGAAALEGRRRAIHGGRRVTAGRQIHARGGVRGGAGLEEREHHRRRAAAAGAGSRARAPERGPRVRQGRGADDPRQPAEDDRRVPHLREARAGRARAAGDDLPRGVHLLRPRPARSRRAAVLAGRSEVPETRAGGVRRQPVPRHAEHGVQEQGGDRLDAQVHRHAGAGARRRVHADDDRAAERRPGQRKGSLTRRAATSRSAAGRSWPPPRRCPSTANTPSGCGTRGSASRTRTWWGRRSRRGTR